MAPAHNTSLVEMVTSDEEQPQDDSESESDSDDDKTPDTNTADSTWMAPKTNQAHNTRSNIVTRARGRQNGIIHTTLLFK